MASTFFGLNIATSALYAYQTGLNTTAHNIANAETEGYSRQTINTKATDAMRLYCTAGMAGTGVEVTDITQVRDEYYDTRFRQNASKLGEYATKEDYMLQIQNFFNEINTSGTTTEFNNFFNALESLRGTPADVDKRTQVINYASSITDYFNSIANNLSRIQENCNSEIKNKVDKINNIAQQVVSLNQQINTIEITGARANDLRDERNRLIDQLSEIVPVETREVHMGDSNLHNFEVKISDQILVDGYDSNKLLCVPREVTANQSDAQGIYDIKWNFTDGQEFKLNDITLTGELRGLIDIRDGNNNECFKGTVTGTAGESKVTVTDTNYNLFSQITLPKTGEITFNNKVYQYTGFTAQKAADGTVTYTFDLKDALDADVSATARVGQDINYKGIPYYQAQLNEFVRTFAAKVNEIQNSAIDLNGDKGIDIFNGIDKVTGKNYTLDESETTFSSTSDSYYQITAQNFSITEEMKGNPNKIATILEGNESAGIDQQGVVDKLIALKNEKGMFQKGTFSEFLIAIVSDIGIDTTKVKNFHESQTDIVNTIKNQRYSVSGVERNEESMNVMKYQRGYNLASKMISVMNECLNKLINEMGV